MKDRSLGECLALIGWSGRQLADMLEMDERQVRRWVAGATVPPHVMEWLAALADVHQRNPPPEKRRKDQ